MGWWCLSVRWSDILVQIEISQQLFDRLPWNVDTHGPQRIKPIEPLLQLCPNLFPWYIICIYKEHIKYVALMVLSGVAKWQGPKCKNRNKKKQAFNDQLNTVIYYPKTNKCKFQKYKVATQKLNTKWKTKEGKVQIRNNMRSRKEKPGGKIRSTAGRHRNRLRGITGDRQRDQGAHRLIVPKFCQCQLKVSSQ